MSQLSLIYKTSVGGKSDLENAVNAALENLHENASNSIECTGYDNLVSHLKKHKITQLEEMLS